MWTNTLNRIRNLKAPSRNTQIFGGIVGTIVGLIAYDKYCTKRIQADLKSKASVIAEMPVEWNTPNRKVRVILEPTHWSKYWFEEFVKPIFDAGALDYSVVNKDLSGEIVEVVRNVVWDAKEHVEQSKFDKDETERLQQKQGWFTSGLTTEEHEREYKKLEAEAIKEYTPHLVEHKYNPAVGLVAMGPIAWRHMLFGLQHGTFTKPKEDGNLPEFKDAILDDENFTMDHFDYPPLGYITSFNRTGFTQWGNRIGGWFTRRYQAERMGQEALRIVYGETRPMVKADEQMGNDLYTLYTPSKKLNERDAKPIDRLYEEWTEHAEKVTLHPQLIEKISIYQ